MRRVDEGYLVAEVVTDRLRYWVDDETGEWMVWAQQPAHWDREPRPYGPYKLDVPDHQVERELYEQRRMLA